MIKSERKAPKPKVIKDMEDMVAEQNKKIGEQTIVIDGLMKTLDDIILNGMGAN